MIGLCLLRKHIISPSGAAQGGSWLPPYQFSIFFPPGLAQQFSGGAAVARHFAPPPSLSKHPGAAPVSPRPRCCLKFINFITLSLFKSKPICCFYCYVFVCLFGWWLVGLVVWFVCLFVCLFVCFVVFCLVCCSGRTWEREKSLSIKVSVLIFRPC